MTKTTIDLDYGDEEWIYTTHFVPKELVPANVVDRCKKNMMNIIMTVMIFLPNLFTPAEPQSSQEESIMHKIQPSPSREDGWWPFGHCL